MDVDDEDDMSTDDDDDVSVFLVVVVFLPYRQGDIKQSFIAVAHVSYCALQW